MEVQSIGGKLVDHVTFTIACYGLSAFQAEKLADEVEQVVYQTEDDLRLLSRRSRIDTSTLMDVAELSVDIWLEPSTDAHVFPQVASGGAFSDSGFDADVFDEGAAAGDYAASAAAAQLLAIVSADPGVQALGASVYLNAADEDAPQPYVVMSAVRGPDLTLMGRPGADRVSFSLACWGATALQAEALADAVERVVYRTQLVMTGRTGGLDDETFADVAVIEAEAWLDKGEAIVADLMAAFDEGAFDEDAYSAAGVGSSHEPNAAVEQLIALLRAAPQLDDLGVIVLNAADEGTPAPYVVVTSTHDTTHTIDGALASDHVTFTLATWARSALEAEAIADAIEAVLADDADDLDVISREGGFDQATTMDVAVLTVDRWV